MQRCGQDSRGQQRSCISWTSNTPGPEGLSRRCGYRDPEKVDRVKGHLTIAMAFKRGCGPFSVIQREGIWKDLYHIILSVPSNLISPVGPTETRGQDAVLMGYSQVQAG